MEFGFKPNLKESKPELKMDNNGKADHQIAQSLVPVQKEKDTQKALVVLPEQAMIQPIKYSRLPDFSDNKFVDRVAKNKWSFPIFVFLCCQSLLLILLTQSRTYLELGSNTLMLSLNGNAANQCFKEAASIDPNSAEVPLFAMKAFTSYFYLESYATEWAEKSLKLKPTAEAYVVLADDAFRQHKWDTAQSLYSKALSLDKNNQEASAGAERLRSINSFDQAK